MYDNTSYAGEQNVVAESVHTVKDNVLARVEY